MTNDSKQTTGIGFTTVLFLIFLVLKLTGTINWSWWWVFAPIWLPVAIVLFCFIVWLLAMAAYEKGRK